ncbi:acyl carrier protein [Methylomarinovum caldicuralii]|uniref:Acyl carrier protein n=1 Tax=Methylomarinovum caldicuralii TaxID=438856 RepID=A0AAU9BRJ0_9GAMM|nr:acyl carrier protein [Methylomarinovum caldicuralii]BCX81423.1 acyl carrier protein [Methylomarinovum caldicuralii]
MKTYQQVLEELLQTLRTLVPQATEIDEDTELVGSLGLDSMKVMNLLQEVEDHFDVSIPLNVLPDVRTVGDLARKIHQQLQD